MGGITNQLTDNPTEPALKGVSRHSPLVVAITKLDYEAANALLKAGAQADAVNRDGRSAMMLLADVHNPCMTPGSLLSLTQLLLSYGANVNLKILDETTPIGVAINSRLVPCIKALIKAGVNLSVEGET
jgi:ankyrin repeat protein